MCFVSYLTDFGKEGLDKTFKSFDHVCFRVNSPLLSSHSHFLFSGKIDLLQTYLCHRHWSLQSNHVIVSKFGRYLLADLESISLSFNLWVIFCVWKFNCFTVDCSALVFPLSEDVDSCYQGCHCPYSSKEIVFGNLSCLLDSVHYCCSVTTPTHYTWLAYSSSAKRRRNEFRSKRHTIFAWRVKRVLLSISL